MTAVTTIPAALAELQRAALAYAPAKSAMEATAWILTEQRAAVRRAVEALAAGEGNAPDEDARQALAEAVKAADAQAVVDTQLLSERIAQWRAALCDLQAASVAVVGVPKPERSPRRTSRLLDAAQAFAAAKAELARHPPPHAGMAYAGLLTAWRGALMDLDAAAHAFASGQGAANQSTIGTAP